MDESHYCPKCKRAIGYPSYDRKTVKAHCPFCDTQLVVLNPADSTPVVGVPLPEKDEAA